MSCWPNALPLPPRSASSFGAKPASITSSPTRHMAVWAVEFVEAAKEATDRALNWAAQLRQAAVEIERQRAPIRCTCPVPYSSPVRSPTRC